MRTASGTLVTAQGLNDRNPVYRVTARDLRLRFTQFGTITNPWSYLNGEMPTGEHYAIGDTEIFNGEVYRAWNGSVQRITTPGTASNWSHASNAWVASTYNQGVGGNPGLIADGGTLYLFYYRNGQVYQRSTTNGTWSGESTFGAATGLGNREAAIAPVSASEIYLSIVVNSGLWIYRITASTQTEMNRRIFAGTGDGFAEPGEDAFSFFDAFSLQGKSWVVYGNATYGKAWVVSYVGGLWSEPIQLVPEDDSRFRPSRVSVIQGRAWLTGLVVRGDSQSVQFFSCLSTTDGENWTTLDRDSYISTSNLIGGKMLLAGNYIYVAGLSTVHRAPATFLIDPAADPAQIGSKYYRRDITADFLSGSLSYPEAGAAPSGGMSLANGNDAYFISPGSDVITSDAEITIEAGYKTTAGDEFVQLFTGRVDAIERVIANGQRAVDVRLLDAPSKKLRTWASPFSWPMLSQSKHSDGLAKLDSLAMISGDQDWTAGNDGDAYYKFTKYDVKGIMTSTVPYETIDCDVRAVFAMVYGPLSAHVYNRSGFGLVCCYVDANNWIALKCLFAASWSVQLVKCRAGVETVLASAAAGLSTFTGKHKVRLVHRGGFFECYMVLNTTNDWGAPAISYAWDQAESPIPSVNRQGKVGVWAHIFPPKFRTSGIDKYSTVIPLAYTNDMDWSLFYDGTYNSARVKIDNELIIANARTQVYDTSNVPGSFATDVVGPYGGYYSEDVISTFPQDPSMATHEDANYFHSQRFYPGAAIDTSFHGTRLGVNRNWECFAIMQRPYAAPYPNGEHRWASYAMTFDGLNTEPYAAWMIRDSSQAAPIGWKAWHPSNGRGDGYTGFTFWPSGHDGVINGATWKPAFHSMMGHPSVSIRPCLYRTGSYGLIETYLNVRGREGTEAVLHLPDSLVYLHTDDEVRLYHFEAYDFARDNNTERLLRRVCAMAGVATEFDSLFSGGPYAIGGAASAWGASPQWIGAYAALRSLDIEFDATLPADGQRVGVGLHPTSQTWPANTFYIAYIERSGSSYYAVWQSGTNHFRYRFSTAALTGSTLHVRVVITTKDDSFITLYVNDMIVMTHRESAYGSALSYNLGLNTYGTGSVTFSNVRIPELFDWRDGVYVDNDTVGATAIAEIIGERPIVSVSRSGETLRFSAFDTRSNLGNFGNTVLEDSDEQDDAEIFSFVRIYAADIVEAINDTLASQHGFLMRILQMPKMETDQAQAAYTRIFRRQQEGYAGRSAAIPADVRAEPEDRFAIVYTASGTGQSVNVNLIVNNVKYELKPGDFVINVGARRWIS